MKIDLCEVWLCSALYALSSFQQGKLQLNIWLVQCVFFTISVRLPRYVRVNLLKTTVEDVVQMFVSEKYEEIENVNLTYTEYVLFDIE